MAYCGKKRSRKDNLGKHIFSRSSPNSVYLLVLLAKFTKLNNVQIVLIWISLSRFIMNLTGKFYLQVEYNQTLRPY